MNDLLEYTIDLATENDIEEIMNIYHSLLGKDCCNWDNNYPGIKEIVSDIDAKSLYKVIDGSVIIAVAAAGKNDELDDIDCYSCDIISPCCLARIGVRSEYQNQGVAKYLLSHIEKQAIARSFDGIHFLVCKTNLHALAVYDKMNYVCCGECNMYGNNWHCYEKKL